MFCWFLIIFPTWITSILNMDYYLYLGLICLTTWQKHGKFFFFCCLYYKRLYFIRKNIFYFVCCFCFFFSFFYLNYVILLCRVLNTSCIFMLVTKLDLFCSRLVIQKAFNTAFWQCLFDLFSFSVSFDATMFFDDYKILVIIFVIT